MKRKRLKEMDYRELAAELARNSIVTKCLARYLEQVIEEVHDSHVKPLRSVLSEIVAAFPDERGAMWDEARALVSKDQT